MVQIVGAGSYTSVVGIDALISLREAIDFALNGRQ